MSYGRGPPKTEGMCSLKVDNLTYRTTPEDLKRVFEKYGDVGDIYIPRDRFTRESRGFAFVRFYDRKDAEDAMDTLDGTILDGRELRVQMAKYGRPSEPPSRRGGQRYGGGGGGGSMRRGRSRSGSRSRSRRHGRRSYSRSNSRSRSRSRGRRSRSRSNSRSRSPKRDRSSRSPQRERSSRSPQKERSSRSPRRERSRSPKPRERSSSKSPTRRNEEPQGDDLE